jgi:dienelactone hydrolase
MQRMGTMTNEVVVSIHGIELGGSLTLPPHARGLVVFAHGSGSSRHSPRNQRVAQALQARGLATLLFDLLSAREEQVDNMDARYRFDIDLLAVRLAEVTDWVTTQPEVAGLPIGYFGASTGAAAALIAAAKRADVVAAVVSRGGRPDLAGRWLPLVRASTLLIVGSADREVLALNRRAQAHLTAPNQLAVVRGATHLFEEPGTLDEVARLAGDWFIVHLGTPAERSAHAVP